MPRLRLLGFLLFHITSGWYTSFAIPQTRGWYTRFTKLLGNTCERVVFK